ncbi:hypothetical protein [Moraxella catarrhalis]|uniref:hypothetical protein n=1 Tax=Moraxella catarrhalis TaxID=480 RepID=UPI0022287C6E|nr:hypothetical protein [Moraxella catarrhalis]
MKHAVLLALSVATFSLSACSFNATAQNPTTTTAISQPPLPKPWVCGLMFVVPKSMPMGIYKGH